MYINRQNLVTSTIILAITLGVFIYNSVEITISSKSNGDKLDKRENHIHTMDQPEKHKPKLIDTMDTSHTITCINTLKTDCYPHLREWFEKLAARKARQNDPELIRFARAMIDAPEAHAMRKLPWGARWTPQSEYVDELLNERRGGFFFEAGAQDGERSSNTAILEVERDWTGLLVEIDPWFYSQMRSKMRHSYTANVGISPYDYVTELQLIESAKGQGKVSMGDQHISSKKQVLSVPCLPLATLFWALNRTKIDYLSLDVEGIEYSILKTFPFSEFDIKTLSIEYVHTNATGVKEIMSDNGYKFLKQMNKSDMKIKLFVDDYIFQKEGRM